MQAYYVTKSVSIHTTGALFDPATQQAARGPRQHIEQGWWRERRAGERTGGCFV